MPWGTFSPQLAQNVSSASLVTDTFVPPPLGLCLLCCPFQEAQDRFGLRELLLYSLYDGHLQTGDSLQFTLETSPEVGWGFNFHPSYGLAP